MKSESADHWVQAQPFRAHAMFLLTTGRLPWRALAILAGVPAPQLHSLLFGRRGRAVARIPAEGARALLAVTPRVIERSRSEVVAATAATRAVLELRGSAWSVTRIATAAALRPEEIESAMSGRLRFTTRRAEVLLLAAAAEARAQLAAERAA